MDLLPLEISVQTGMWRGDDDQFIASDQDWAKLKRQVFERDDSTCRYCGFRSTKWQEVHHLDEDITNNTLDNTVTACTFCRQIFNISFAASRNAIRICWIPELTHAEINHMIRSKLVLEAWLAKLPRNTAGQEADALRMMAMSLNGSLDIRGSVISETMGGSSPDVLANALIEVRRTNMDLYEQRSMLLDGIRVVPTGAKRETSQGSDIMAAMVAHWMDETGPYAGALPQTWGTMVRNYNSRLNA